MNALPHGLGVKAKVANEDAEDAKTDASVTEAGPSGSKSNEAESTEAEPARDEPMEAEPTGDEPVEAKTTEAEHTEAEADDEAESTAAEPTEAEANGVEIGATELEESGEAQDKTDGQDGQNKKTSEAATIASGTTQQPITKTKTKTKTKRTKKPKAKLGISPYPRLARPTPEECYKLNELLSKAHGEVAAPEAVPVPSQTVAGCGEVKFVLEALVRTHLSAHTSMANANRAIQGLLERYKTFKDGPFAGSVDWNEVRLSGQDELEKAIRRGGMAPTKSKAIKKMLDMVYEENQARREELKAKVSQSSSAEDGTEDKSKAKTSKDPLVGDIKSAIMARFANEILVESDSIMTLDYVHAMEPADAFDKLLTYPGIGIKTAACVLLFCMQRPFFAVDTHVWRLCKWLHWVPEKATRDQTFWHCDVKVPDDLKYSLHQLMIVHGKSCGRCRANPSESSEVWAEGCPIDELVKRTGVRKGGKEKPQPKGKKRKAKAEEEEDEDEEGETKPKAKSRKVNTKPATGKAVTKKVKATPRSKKTAATSEDQDIAEAPPGPAKPKGKKGAPKKGASASTAAKGKKGKAAATAATAADNEAEGHGEDAESSRPKADFFKPVAKKATPPVDETKKDLAKEIATQDQEEQADDEAEAILEASN